MKALSGCRGYTGNGASWKMMGGPSVCSPIPAVDVAAGCVDTMPAVVTRCDAGCVDTAVGPSYPTLLSWQRQKKFHCEDLLTLPKAV